MSYYDEEVLSSVYMDGYSEGFYYGYMKCLYDLEHQDPPSSYVFEKYEPYVFLGKSEYERRS